MGNNKLTGGTKPALLAHVILGLVPKILWQRVANQVNKLAILLHKEYVHTRLSGQTVRPPDNDWYTGRWLSVCCMFLKYPLPEAYASASPSWGEVIGLLRHARNDDRVSSWH